MKPIRPIWSTAARRWAEHAVDDLRARFGDAVLIRGLGFRPGGEVAGI